jgi:hypothetical protein
MFNNGQMTPEFFFLFFPFLRRGQILQYRYIRIRPTCSALADHCQLQLEVRIWHLDKIGLSRIPLLNRVCSPPKRRRGRFILELRYLPLSAIANCESWNLSADGFVKKFSSWSVRGRFGTGIFDLASAW